MPVADMVQILEPEHYSKAGKLWQISFAAPYDIFATQQYIEKQLSRLTGVFDGDTLAATLGIIDFSMGIGGHEVSCAGIAAVATHPNYRRRGLTARLIGEALPHLYEREIAVAALWPFSYPFYERFGWQVSDRQYKVRLDLAALHKLGDASCYRHIEPFIGSADASGDAAQGELAVAIDGRLSELHHRWCQRYSLSLGRNAVRWKRLLGRPGASWLVLLHDEGYMLIDLSASENRATEKSELVVREWCYLSARAFKDGLALLGQMDSQFQSASCILPSVDDFYRLNLHSRSRIEVLPGMMSRAVDSKALAGAMALDFRGLSLSDPLALEPPSTSGTSVGVGELIQELVAFHNSPTPGLEHIYGRAGLPSFSVEKF